MSLVIEGAKTVLREIVEAAKSDTQKIFETAINTVLGRIDETRAACQANLRPDSPRQ